MRGSQANKTIENDSKPPDPQNFEISPLRFEYEAITQEYVVLRNEITARIQKQQEITSFAIAVIVGFVTINQFVFGSNPILDPDLAIKIFYPIVSLIMSAFSLMVFEHDANIAHLLTYIDSHLKPRIMDILQSTGNEQHVWEWNKKRARWQHGSGITDLLNVVMAGSKYSMTILPNVIIIFFIIFNSDWSFSYQTYTQFINAILNNLLFILALLVFTWTIITGLYVGRLYSKMVEKDNLLET